MQEKKMLFARKLNGEWRKYSAHEYVNLSESFSLGLLALGVKKGDKIATITPNRPE